MHLSPFLSTLFLAGVVGSAALHAQVPARFPAIAADTLQSVTRNARCANTVRAIARTVGETENWRGYGMLLCDPDGEAAGHFVAWQNRNDRSQFIPARADGQRIPVSEHGFHNDSQNQAQVTVFGLRVGGQPAICWFARSNHMREPWVSSFCQRPE